MSDKHITLLTHIRGKVAREAPYAGGDAWTEALDWAIDQLRWRPIEEAPTDDGFEAIVSGLLYNQGPGRWVSTAVLFDLEWWMSEDDRVEGHGPLYAPTHWLPLPGPPEAA